MFVWWVASSKPPALTFLNRNSDRNRPLWWECFHWRGEKMPLLPITARHPFTPEALITETWVSYQWRPPQPWLCYFSANQKVNTTVYYHSTCKPRAAGLKWLKRSKLYSKQHVAQKMKMFLLPFILRQINSNTRPYIRSAVIRFSNLFNHIVVIFPPYL